MAKSTARKPAKGRKAAGKGKSTPKGKKTVQSKPKHDLKWYREDHVKIPGELYKVNERSTQKIKVGKGKYKTVKKNNYGPLGMYPSDPKAKKKYLEAKAKLTPRGQQKLDTSILRAESRNRRYQDEYEYEMARGYADYMDERDIRADLEDRGYSDSDKYWKSKSKTRQAQALRKQAWEDHRTYNGY